MKKLLSYAIALIFAVAIFVANNAPINDYTVSALSLISICIFGLAKVGCEE